MSEPTKNESLWYQKGLNFKCTGCGKCCTGAPGYVWVNEREMQDIADFLQITLQDFKKKYIRRVGSRYSLVEMKTTYSCVFLKDGKCQVYKARPTQCRTFPYWPQNLISKEAWQETAKECEGISADAPLVNIKTIEEERLIQLRRHEEKSTN